MTDPGRAVDGITSPSSVARSSHRLTLAVLMVAVCSFTLLQSLVVPVLGELQRDLHTDQPTVTWVLTAYLLSASVCTPLLGRLGDVVGKKRIVVLALVALSVGSLMAALSASVAWLIVARVVQGAGGGVLPLSFGIIRDEFPSDRTNGALSVVASLSAVGFGIGTVAAGPIVTVLGYRWLFWLPMITTGLAAVGAAMVVPESPARAAGRIPLLPAAMVRSTVPATQLDCRDQPHSVVENRYSECVSLGMWIGSSHTRLAIMKAMTCDHRPPCPAADATNAHEAHVAIWHVEQGWCLLCNGVILFEDGGAIMPDCRAVEPPDRLARHAA